MARTKPAKRARKAPRAAAPIEHASDAPRDIKQLSIKALFGDMRAVIGADPARVHFLMRICGSVRAFRVLHGVRGTGVRLAGEFFARTVTGETVRAPVAYLPEPITAEVVRTLREYRRKSTRDRPAVLIEFDVGALPEFLSPTGYVLKCEGRVFIPRPLDELIATALARALPPATHEEGTHP